MVWRWYLAAAPLKATNDARVQADIVYYDSDDPANSGVSLTVPPTNMLHAQTFYFDPAWTNANMQSAIQDEGKRARAALDRAAVLAGAFPKGTSGLVP